MIDGKIIRERDRQVKPRYVNERARATRLMGDLNLLMSHTRWKNTREYVSRDLEPWIRNRGSMSSNEVLSSTPNGIY